jgi:hypothetical protein
MVSAHISLSGEGMTNAAAVDGLSPRKASERMIEWLQKPVDYNPPTFANGTVSKL